jgi:hypothetical protein
MRFIAFNIIIASFVIMGFQNCGNYEAISESHLTQHASFGENGQSANDSSVENNNTTSQSAPAEVGTKCGISSARLLQIHDLLEKVLDGQQTHLMDSAKTAANYPYIIYDIQELTAGVLKAGENCKDTFILDRLAKLYAVPFSHLKVDPDGHKVWAGTDGYEVLLSSTQFLYAVAKLIKIISGIDQKLWTSSMNSFMYEPRGILKAHFERWLFKASVGSCFGSERLITFPEYVQKKYNREFGPETYCNAAWEPEFWIAAAAAEFLSAKNWVGLSSSSEIALTQYVRSAVRLFESRLSTRYACPDKACLGLLFDVGGWKGHPEYPADLWPIGGEVWDFSHMRRIVQWVDAFYLHIDITDAKYSSHEGVVALLANELAYQVFNRNFTNPAFTNFWNGWAINYRHYGPYDLSASYFRAGYGFWAQYRSEIRDINNALLDLVDNKKSSTYMTPNGSPPQGDFDLLNFYSSLTVPDGA